MTALLDGSQLVFEVHAGSAGRDHVLHQFEGVEHAAEAGFSVGHDRQEVVDEFLVARVDAAAPLDFVRALEGVVDATDHRRHRVVGVQRLVGVHRFRGVAVGGDLPARQVHGFQAGLGLLHRLAGGDRAEGVHVALLGTAVDLGPELFSAALGQRVLDGERTAQANHVGCAVAALHALPARIGGPVLFEGGNLLFAAQLFVQGLGHGHSVRLIEGWRCGRGVTVIRLRTLMSYRRHIFEPTKSTTYGDISQ
ncbi:hypothetical protein FQZ97_921770 [compost metagenome]